MQKQTRTLAGDAGIVIAVMAVGAYFVFDYTPITAAQAAGQAALCVGWPGGVAQEAAASFTPKAEELKEPVVLFFAHAKVVNVTDAGGCAEMHDAALVSRPLMHMPPMARVPGGKQDYVLYYMGEAGKTYHFVAVRAGTQVIRQEPPPQNGQGPI